MSEELQVIVRPQYNVYDPLAESNVQFKRLTMNYFKAACNR
jgi:hypothetical protein